MCSATKSQQDWGKLARQKLGLPVLCCHSESEAVPSVHEEIFCNVAHWIGMICSRWLHPHSVLCEHGTRRKTHEVERWPSSAKNSVSGLTQQSADNEMWASRRCDPPELSERPICRTKTSRITQPLRFSFILINHHRALWLCAASSSMQGYGRCRQPNIAYSKMLIVAAS